MTEANLGELLPLWSTAPFAVLLLAIATLPLALPHWWHPNRNKALVSLLLGLPVAATIAWLEPGRLLHDAHEYAAFIILLGTLYVISGGVVVQGSLAGTPGVNTAMLATGTLLASLIGTTGASMLLIRPLLRANAVRRRKVHVIVFFIFLVSNVGGALTPLGDPPLFLGFLRGVPFWWTLRLWPYWAAVSGVLLAAFYVIDSTLLREDDLSTPGDLDEAAALHEPLVLAGQHNLVFLAGVVGVVIAAGSLAPPPGVQEAGMLLMAGLSLATTPRALRQANQFTWGPIVEVTVIFAGIFATMIPALAILNARGHELGLEHPWHFFWATGLLSSFLDNAPTYLAFASTASGLVGTSADDLAGLAGHPTGEGLLVAISVGAVFMGANTYIGNGPNFMVKAMAEEAGVVMPSFFGYMAWSGAVLIPAFVVLTALAFT